ncbi:MAG: TIGR03936 family radical SAM-associated protein [Chloroflexi bacterium]|nr:TIGR03936 family radical SAM-associated protein [Chloroflexota bacterium]
MRIRITFAKTGALRYIGHLDLHKLWERTSRRANLALIYSQGFHPQPKIQLASALPLGFASRCELVDMWIDGDVNLATLPARLEKAVPPGLGIIKVEDVDEKSPPLQTQVTFAEYEATMFYQVDSDWLASQISACLQAETLPRERRGKAYDLRPLIESINIIDLDSEGNKRLSILLAAREGATGRPEEVLDALGIPYEETRIERCQFLFKSNQ